MSLVQFNTAKTPSGATTIPATFGAGTTAANVLIAMIGGVDGSTDIATAFTMPSGWVSAGSFINEANHTVGQLWVYPNNPGGITSVVGGITGGADTSVFLCIGELNDGPFTSTIDVHAENPQGAAANTDPETVTLVTTKDGDLLLFGVIELSVTQATYGAISGWTQVDTQALGGWDGSFAFYYKIQATHASISPSISSATATFWLAIGSAVEPPTPSTTLHPTGIATGEAFGTLGAQFPSKNKDIGRVTIPALPSIGGQHATFN